MQPVTWLKALLWVAFIATPRPATGIINGIPLGPIEAAALLAVGWLLLQGSRLAGAFVVAAALVVSLVLSYIVPEAGGFTARYFANADAAGTFERSTDYRGTDFTRVDRTLDFEAGRAELELGLGRAEFPLAFFNDLGRFNFYQPHEPRRELLAFSVVWDGHWRVETDTAPRELYLDAPGANAEVLVDGTRVVAVAPLDAPHSAVVTPARGWHSVQVRFSSPYGSPRRLSVGERVGEQRQPFGAPAISTVPAQPPPMVRAIAFALDAAVLIWLDVLLLLAIGQLFRQMRGRWPISAPSRELVALLLLAAAIEAMIFAAPWSRQMMTLVGGDDTLTYESYARQIQLDSFLLAHGGGEPFFYQVLYPYVLAAMHVVFGESMFGPILVQRLLLALLAWMIVKIAVRIAGDRVLWPALACGAGFAYALVGPISAKLLNESLFIPLLVAWVAAVLGASAAPTWPRVIGAGLLGGVTTLTRSTALVAWVVAAATCWFSWKAVPRRALLVVAMVAGSCAVMSFIAVRNWIVVREVILMPGELPVTLHGGNEPPSGLAIAEPRRAFYNRVGLHPLTRQVVEYAITAPAPFFRNLFNKAIFALGYFDLYAPGWGYSVGLLLISAASLAGLVLVVRHPATSVRVAVFPALVALTQYAAVVIVYPKGMRLILPFHALMVPYAAAAAAALYRRMLMVPRAES